MSNKNTNKRIDQEFFPSFSKVFKAGSIAFIKDHQEVSIPWDIYSAVIYSFLLNKFNYHNQLSISQDAISSNCNCSVDVVKSRLALMEDAGIVKIKRQPNGSGLMKANLYTNVIDITKSNKYRLINSKFTQHYYDLMKDRKKRLALLDGVVLKRSWTSHQVRNYLANRNYELVTGVYLDGDKLSSKLYMKYYNDKPEHDLSQGFKLNDEIREYEYNTLIGNATYEEDL